jgi:hypothetical protein
MASSNWSGSLSSGDLFVLLIIAMTVVLPLAMLTYFIRRYLNLKERELAAGQAQLEQRVRVLEQIATDSGVQTAAQIAALNRPPAEPKDG